jgi:hypothetical protein
MSFRRWEIGSSGKYALVLVIKLYNYECFSRVKAFKRLYSSVKVGRSRCGFAFEMPDKTGLGGVKIVHVIRRRPSFSARACVRGFQFNAHATPGSNQRTEVFRSFSCRAPTVFDMLTCM